MLETEGKCMLGHVNLPFGWKYPGENRIESRRGSRLKGSRWTTEGGQGNGKNLDERNRSEDGDASKSPTQTPLWRRKEVKSGLLWP